MKKILLFVFALILTACLPSPEGIPQAAVTSTPPPTITPIPTIPPQFLALQEQITQSDNFTLNADGQIEMQTPDGMIIVSGILVSKDGTMTVTHEGEEFEADPTTIKIDGQVLTFQDKEGKTWVWDGKTLQEEIAEIREFVPANTIEFTETLSNYDLKLAPDADLKAIYWDIAVVQLGSATSKSQGMEENRKVYEEIIKDFPQWEGIGSGSDYKERVAFMKEFLKRTGGKMIVQNHNFEKFEADFNKPIGFEVIEVNEFPKGYKGYLMGTGNNANNITGGGGIMLVDSSGKLVYQTVILPNALERTQTDSGYLYRSWGWTEAEVVSDMIRKIISETSYKDRDSDMHKYSLYTKGADPKSSGYYRDVSWTFIR